MYNWRGMEKIGLGEIIELHNKNQLAGNFMLYPDGTEAEILPGYDWKDIAEHYKRGGEFGHEKREKQANDLFSECNYERE